MCARSICRLADLDSPHELAPNPAAGQQSLRLSSIKEKAERGASIAAEPEAVFSVASWPATPPCPPVQDQSAAPKEDTQPKPPVLKGYLKLCPDEARPLVEIFETGQSFVIRRVFRAPLAAKAAAFTEQEREQLSGLTCEVLNRRPPRVLVENGDLFALAMKLAAIESRKIEQVSKGAEQAREGDAQNKSVSQPVQPQLVQSARETFGVLVAWPTAEPTRLYRATINIHLLRIQLEC